MYYTVVYSIAPTELEVAALVYAVEHFEVYLLGNEFTVYTDHQSLVSAYITHMKSQSRGLLAWWYLQISRFLPKMHLEHYYCSVWYRYGDLD